MKSRKQTLNRQAPIHNARAQQTTLATRHHKACWPSTQFHYLYKPFPPLQLPFLTSFSSPLHLHCAILYSAEMNARKSVFLFMFVTVIRNGAMANEFKVGGMDAWGIPTGGRTELYKQWVSNNKFKLGDSLLFLYPPSQDSVIEVTEEAYIKCNISSPIATYHDGNTIFQFNTSGYFYFTSGKPGHCEKSQKLAVPVVDANGALPPASGPTVGLFTSVGVSPAPSAMPTNSGSMMQPTHFLGFLVGLAFALYVLL